MDLQNLFLFIDDEMHEHHFVHAAMDHLGYADRMVSFFNGREAFEFIRNTDEPIFLILSDLNMPGMNGLELKRLLDSTPELRLRSIPFIFHSSSANPVEIKEAYSLNIQGYFRKHTHISDTISCLETIVRFWSECVHPNQL